jgi:hypothetical protein
MLQLNISLATYFDVPPELKRVNQPERRGRRPSAPQPPPPESRESEG